jgi:phosphoglycerol transferase
MTSAETVVRAGAESAAPDPSPAVPPLSRGARPGWRREVPVVVATLALTLVALTLVLQLWRATPGVPFTSEADAAFNVMTVQTIIDTGWYERAPRLGAPFGASLHDFPLGGDNLQFLLIRGLAAFSSDAGTVVNAYFLVTFLLVALAGLLVLRWLGVSRPVAAVLAVLYAFLPYHFFRGETHLFLSGYWAVPLGVALAVSGMRGAALFERRPGHRGPASFATRRTAVTLGLAAVIGSSGSYYAAFAVVLLAAVGALHALRGRTLRAAVPAAVAAAAIVGVLGLNLLPDVAYRVEHGANERVGQRDPAETERFGLKLSSMLLPDPGHRVASLGTLGERYRVMSDVPSEGGQSLGLVGALGLLWLLAAALTAVAGGRALPDTVETHRTLAFLAVVTLLTGTVGGFSMLVALSLTPQFRSWNRVSVVLGFLSLAALGLLLDRWWARRGQAGAGSRRRPAGAAGLAFLLLFGLLDQTGASAVPRYRANAAEHDSDAAFVTAIEDRLPTGAMLYQLPYVSFPESAPIAGTGGYDQVRGYLHSKDLRWSFGAARGRDHGWQDALLGQPPDLVLRRLVAVGFAGLWVDRRGYVDDAASLEAGLAAALGESPLVSADGRLSFFSLLDFQATLRRTSPAAELDALAAQTLAPVEVRPGQGAQRHRQDGSTHWIDGEASATLHAANPADTVRTVVFDARVEAAGDGTLSVIWPDGSNETVPVTAGETALRRRIAVPPGLQAIRFAVDTPPFARQDRPHIRFRLLRPAAYDEPPADFR